MQCKAERDLYHKMYACLFNAMTDALREIEEQNYGRAGLIMREAQRKTEKLFMDSDLAEEKPPVFP